MPTLASVNHLITADGDYTHAIPKPGGVYRLSVGDDGDDFGGGTVTLTQCGEVLGTYTTNGGVAADLHYGYDLKFALTGATSPSINIIVQQSNWGET